MERTLSNVIKHITEITSDSDALETQGVSPDDILEALEDFGWERGGIDKNGWDIDYWIFAENEATNQKIVMSGSVYYGRSLKIQFCHEDEYIKKGEEC